MKTKTKRLVSGVGINDADYVTQISITLSGTGKNRKRKVIWCCPYYRTWAGMLKRGYSQKQKKVRPTYEDCTVCKDWHTFSNFKAWMEKQDWQGKELDKDLLVRGNKTYSPETCIFIDYVINTFLTEPNVGAEGLPGTVWDKQRKKFTAQISNPFTKKNEKLGRYDSQIDAHKAWLARKLEFATELAYGQDNIMVRDALIARYENYKYHVSREEMFDMLLSDIVLPWPSLSEDEKKVVDANYDKLYKSLEDVL